MNITPAPVRGGLNRRCAFWGERSTWHDSRSVLPSDSKLRVREIHEARPFASAEEPEKLLGNSRRLFVVVSGEVTHPAQVDAPGPG